VLSSDDGGTSFAHLWAAGVLMASEQRARFALKWMANSGARPQHVRLRNNLGSVGYPVLPVEACFERDSSEQTETSNHAV
jgi:hypothetical protein